jgi:hypothetical protein
MSDDAGAREAHATVTDSEEYREPVSGDQAERPEFRDESDEILDADAVIIAEEDERPHADTVPAQPIVAEPVPAEARPADPAEARLADPVPAGADSVQPAPAASAARPAPAAATVADTVPDRAGQTAGDPEQLHQRWAAIQSTFVDDPRGSVTSAAALVTEVIDTVVASAKQRESGLRGGWEGDGVDTEGLRNALRGYRALLDQLVAL